MMMILMLTMTTMTTLGCCVFQVTMTTSQTRTSAMYDAVKLQHIIAHSVIIGTHNSFE